jgi:hypothetical protein
MNRLIPVSLAGLAALASCAAPQPGSQPEAETAARSAQAANAEDCLNLPAIRETRVIDDRTIDFYMRDGSIYRNALPYACPQLGLEEAFTYKTSLSKLCSADIIRVVHTGAGPTLGASCGLGKFVPYTPPPAED